MAMVDQHDIGAQPAHSHSGGPVDTLMEEIWDMMIVMMGMVIVTAIRYGGLVEALGVVMDPVEVMMVVMDQVEVPVDLVDLGDMEDVAALVALGGQDGDLGAGLVQMVATTGEPGMLPTLELP